MGRKRQDRKGPRRLRTYTGVCQARTGERGNGCTAPRRPGRWLRGTLRGAAVYKLGTIMKNTQTLAPQKVALRFSASERGSPVRFVSFRRKVFISARRVLSERSSTLGSASVVVSVRHRSPVTAVSVITEYSTRPSGPPRHFRQSPTWSPPKTEGEVPPLPDTRG